MKAVDFFDDEDLFFCLQSPSFLPSPAVDSRVMSSSESDFALPTPHYATECLSHTLSGGGISNASTAHNPQPQMQSINTATGSQGKVLLLRNLPPNVVEAGVESFVSPFIKSSPPNIYLQFATGQAFVEFGVSEIEYDTNMNTHRIWKGSLWV